MTAESYTPLLLLEDPEAAAHDAKQAHPGDQADAEDVDETMYRAAVLNSGISANQHWLHVEHSSTYGAALMIPQVARSAGWPIPLLISSIRSFFFLFGGMALQIYLLNQMNRESYVMSNFAGQMHLCDFSVGTRGPGGTMITPERTYDFGQWSTRRFARDSLKMLFPDRADDIDAGMDVGEYALESFGARWCSIFLFMIVTFEELRRIYHLAVLLWGVPTRAGHWIVPESASEGKTFLDQVKLRISGIPLAWKAVYIVTMLIPKILIWKMCCHTGVDFLMETSSIVGILVNCVALAFILNLDESVCETMMHEKVRIMLARCKGYPLHDPDSQKDLGEEQALMNADHTSLKRKAEITAEFFKEHTLKNMSCRQFSGWFPEKLFLIVILSVFFSIDYYHRNCEYSKEGHLVSKPMHTPKTTHLSLAVNILPNFFKLAVVDSPYWTMPEVDD